MNLHRVLGALCVLRRLQERCAYFGRRHCRGSSLPGRSHMMSLHGVEAWEQQRRSHSARVHLVCWFCESVQDEHMHVCREHGGLCSANAPEEMRTWSG